MYVYINEWYCLYIAMNNFVIFLFFFRVDKVIEEIWECKEVREFWCVVWFELILSCLVNNYFMQELFFLLEKFKLLGFLNVICINNFLKINFFFKFMINLNYVNFNNFYLIVKCYFKFLSLNVLVILVGYIVWVFNVQKVFLVYLNIVLFKLCSREMFRC